MKCSWAKKLIFLREVNNSFYFSIHLTNQVFNPEKTLSQILHKNNLLYGQLSANSLKALTRFIKTNVTQCLLSLCLSVDSFGFKGNATLWLNPIFRSFAFCWDGDRYNSIAWSRLSKGLIAAFKPSKIIENLSTKNKLAQLSKNLHRPRERADRRRLLTIANAKSF